jgi:hypothetical protein
MTKFFEDYFRTPRQVRLGIWMATALGDIPVSKDIARKVGLPQAATMFDYADALIEYANSQGWSQELAALLEQDIRDAYLDRPTRRYLHSRSFEGASRDQNGDAPDA